MHAFIQLYNNFLFVWADTDLKSETNANFNPLPPFQTQLVEDPAGSSKESTSFSLSFSMFHQNFTELEFRKILFHLLVLSFSDVKIQDLKDSKRENVSKNVGCGEGREIYKQPKNS